MARVILLTDFGEEYSNNLLKGIVKYSRETSPWALCKMPLSFRDLHGVEGIVEWAKTWKADAIIGQFYNTDNLNLLQEAGILVIAQDFKEKFSSIPNITGNHILAGKLGAQHFIQKQFINYAFLGVKDAIWSNERCLGFKEELEGKSFTFYEYHKDFHEDLWNYNDRLKEWLFNLPKPIAIMACDDNQAKHISEICLLENIKIPQEIALLGVDNDQMICLLSSPNISSLNQNTTKGGYEVAHLIDLMLDNPSYKWKDIVVEPTYITTRASSNIFYTEDEHISTVLNFIHNNLNKKINVDTLLDMVPLSRRALEILFKKHIGSSIYSYILNLRIERFAALLIETKKTIIEIALELDNVDYKNLSRQFKQVKGCTPSEYRELFQY